jgi:hypothetical protein
MAGLHPGRTQQPARPPYPKLETLFQDAGTLRRISMLQIHFAAGSWDKLAPI